jgi:hypothetical protein
VVNEVQELAVGQELVDIAEDAEIPSSPDPVEVDPTRPLRRKK